MNKEEEREQINKALHEARPGNLCWHIERDDWFCFKCDDSKNTDQVCPFKHVCLECNAPIGKLCKVCGEGFMYIEFPENPIYDDDLNAMAEVEAEFSYFQKQDYRWALKRLNPSKLLEDVLFNPAHIRAKAALKVLEDKNKENKLP